jgi:AraC-like DNA-binding protein
MGYCSGAYFSQKFRAATGHTPSAYRRIQQGLPARRQNRQQKGKSESKTPIAETPQKE